MGRVHRPSYSYRYARSRPAARGRPAAIYLAWLLLRQWLCFALLMTLNPHHFFAVLLVFVLVLIAGLSGVSLENKHHWLTLHF